MADENLIISFDKKKTGRFISSFFLLIALWVVFFVLSGKVFPLSVYLFILYFCLLFYLSFPQHLITLLGLFLLLLSPFFMMFRQEETANIYAGASFITLMASVLKSAADTLFKRGRDEGPDLSGGGN